MNTHVNFHKNPVVAVSAAQRDTWHLETLSTPNSSVARLIAALGTADFARQLVYEAAELINVRHLALVAFDDLLVPHIVDSESTESSAVTAAAGQLYKSSLFYRHDPNVTMLRSGVEGDDTLLLRLRASEIQDKEYRQNIYERFALVDRLSILSHTNDHWMAINFYRERRFGEFAASDILVVQRTAALIAALVSKHFALAPPVPWQKTRRPSVEHLEYLVEQLDTRLTTRQMQVCARALLGMTSEAIGLDLGIRKPTVATLRKRAYSLLQISSLNELFALCLARTSRAD